MLELTFPGPSRMRFMLGLDGAAEMFVNSSARDSFTEYVF